MASQRVANARLLRAKCRSSHSGAMRSIEPGISRFRVWSFGPSRNDGALDCFVASLVRATRLKIRAWPALRALVRPHQICEPPEQIMRVARAGRRLGVILHREYRLALELDAAIGAVEQRNMGLGRTLRHGRLIDRETVVHRGDFHLAGGLVLDRMIGAVMALVHLHG